MASTRDCRNWRPNSLICDVLASPGGDVATIAAMAATKTILIVFMVGRNPVKAGFVAHLNRPGGNATGLNILTSELAAKRL